MLQSNREIMIRQRRLETFLPALVLVAMLSACTSNSSSQRVETAADSTLTEIIDQVDEALVNRNFARADSLSVRLVNEHPQEFLSWLTRGNTFLRLGRLDQAQAAFQKAHEIRPEHPAPLHELGNIAVAQQEYVSAVGFYRRAASGESGPQPWHGLGRAYLQIGNYDSARVALDKSIELAPTYAGNYAALSELDQIDGDHAQAVANMRRAFQLEPSSKLYRSDYGRLLTSAGQYAEALTVLQPLLEQPPVKAQTLFVLARTLRGLERTEEAAHIEAEFEHLAELEEAVFRLEERVRLNPRGVRDRLSLADAYREGSSPHQAIDQLLIVEMISEPNASLQRNLASLFAAIGNSTESARRIELAEKIEQHD